MAIGASNRFASLQVFDLAGRTSVSHACRVFGIHRSTYYAWKAQVDRGGLEMLRPKERRRPHMPNQLSAVVEERIVSFAIAHPGLGPKRIAAELGRDKWGRSSSLPTASTTRCAATGSTRAS